MSKFSVRFNENDEAKLDQINIHSKTAKNDKLKHLVNNYQIWMDEIDALKKSNQKLTQDREQLSAAYQEKIAADELYNAAIKTMVST